MSTIIRTRVTAGEVKPGDTLLTVKGSPVVRKVVRSKKGKVMAWVGTGNPVNLGTEDAPVWVHHGAVSQAPTR